MENHADRYPEQGASEMSKTALDEVRGDHRNMSVLLALLQRDLESLREATESLVDVQRVADIVDYFAHYPDQVHHPREETIFAVFGEHHEASPQLEIALARVREQHDSLPKATAALHAMLVAATHEALIPRAELVARLEDYIARQIEHLELEDRLVFPELAEKMSDQDWQEVQRRGPHGRDPVFGGDFEEAYARLYRRLESVGAGH